MAATERSPAIRLLTAADLDAAVALSASAHWNQNRADWQTMLQLGQGWGLDGVDDAGREVLAASAVVLPYGTDFAWTSMVLVLPAFQRRGYARQLLRHALAHLGAQGRAAILDATPAGRAVYVQEGFADTWGFARYRREAGATTSSRRPNGPPTRPLADRDWPAIEALDTPAFGASRLPLLQSLAQRRPQAAHVVEVGGRLRGYVLGRDGREAGQIGPLLAEDDGVAIALLEHALHAEPGALYIDLLDSRRSLLPWLQAAGFVFQRPFTRMVHGTSAAPGDPAAIVLAAGPELG